MTNNQIIERQKKQRLQVEFNSFVCGFANKSNITILEFSEWAVAYIIYKKAQVMGLDINSVQYLGNSLLKSTTIITTEDIGLLYKKACTKIKEDLGQQEIEKTL